MHALADPLDAGVLRLAVPNAPVQTLDFSDDHSLRRHPVRQFVAASVLKLASWLMLWSCVTYLLARKYWRRSAEQCISRN
jgi:hypothetical protein